jgi:predicted DNA-binding WGR domain protein
MVNPSVEIDNHCPKDLQSYFKVLCDDADDYSCALNMADVVNNCNKSYIMQLLERNGETYVLFSRFGRVGQIGQMATEIFVDKDLAIKEFCSIFYEKTGIAWSNRYTDQDNVKNGKYQFILMKRDNIHVVVDKTPQPEEAVTLDDSVQRFIKLIYDPALYGGAGESFGFDTKKLPLGSLGLAQIQKASKIISEIGKLIDAESGEVKKGKESEVNRLSSLFYTSVPSAQSKLKPLNTLSQLEEKGDLLDLLRNMSYMSKNVDKGVMEKYHKLETTITHVDSATGMMIDNYLKTNVGATHNFTLKILDIYKIDKPKETQAYRKWDGLHNKQLLWHGTRLANAVGILTTGLRINPTGVPTTGKMFGNGLYFANASTKSAGYMGLQGKGRGLLFLCEVALGNMYERLQAENVVGLPDGRHSTKGLGSWQPDPEQHIDVDDVTVPIGRLKQGSTVNKALHYDEFIVYDTSQIKMRYVVVVECG